MIRAVVSAHVNASADFVRSLYEDPDNWAKLFPATIRGAHVVRRDQHRTVVEVSHIEGKVVNILQFISPARIDVTEFKRRYTATFHKRIHSRRRGHVLQDHRDHLLAMALQIDVAVSKTDRGCENAPFYRGAVEGGGRA